MTVFESKSQTMVNKTFDRLRVKSNEFVLFEIYYYICKHEYSKIVKHSFVGLCSHVNALLKKKADKHRLCYQFVSVIKAET